MPAFVEATEFYVAIGGTDVSTRWASKLIKLTVNDNSGKDADSATVELDDTGGMIAMPQKKAPVTISLNGGQVFDGIVDDVKHTYDRGGGRRLTVEAKSADTEGKQKEPQRQHWDDKTVGDAIFEAGKKADVQVDVAPRIKKLKRKYIAQDNEHFLHFAQRIADETNGTFKMIGGTRGVILDRGTGQTIGGQSIGSFRVTAGGNLISSDISPIMVRPQYKEVRARWYDRKKAKWIEEKVQVTGAGDRAKVPADVRYTRPDKDESEQAAGSTANESKREAGSGTVIADGSPEARAEAKLVLSGVRQGVDGEYLIDKATHELERGGGYRVTCTVKQPDKEAGKDSRTGTKAGSGSSTGGGGAYTPDPIFSGT